jgi:hypothetical protein
MWKWVRFSAVAAALFAAGCGYAVKTGAVQDKAVDLSGYGTFFMLPGSTSGDSVADHQIKTDVEAELAHKGRVEVPAGEGGAVVVVHAATSSSHSSQSFYRGWGGWRWWGDPGTANPVANDYKIGTVVVDIFDARTKRALWSGYVVDAISAHPDKDGERLQDGIERMFRTLPFSTREAASVSSHAPQIIFSASPAILILVEGDPQYRTVGGTEVQRVTNTRPLILRDDAGIFYLKIGDGWMQAYSLTGWWAVAGTVPDGGNVALREAAASNDVDLLDGEPSLTEEPPTVYVATTTAKLIVTNGPPQFGKIRGSSLLRVENTSARVFKEPTDEELYVLISDRWFRAWTTDGPWEGVSRNELPTDLAEMPDEMLKE